VLKTTGDEKSDLSIPDDRSIEDTVHAEDGGLGRVDYGRSEQGTKHSAVAAKRVVIYGTKLHSVKLP
jgi:hypothetical protein